MRFDLQPRRGKYFFKEEGRNMVQKRFLLTVVLSTLLAVLSMGFMTLTASAQAVASPAHSVTFKVGTTPLSGTPNSNIKDNKKGKPVFKPKKLSCTQIQGQACNTITNTTNENVDVYLNGTYFFSQIPGQVNYIYYGGAGTYVYTIPNQNHKTKLTVTVTMG
jgi:hypothetical protein